MKITYKEVVINHIFIFCDNHEEATKELIDFGFTEGTGRIHPNQGTRNRKFNFENFFLEIIWVHNEEEATSSLTAPTKLYERSLYATNEYAPFGLCLNYDSKDDAVFKDAFIYKPTYMPPDMSIEVLTHENEPLLPWTFRWKTDTISHTNNDYIPHHNSIVQLSKAIFASSDDKNMFLTLIFDGFKKKSKKVFDSLPLVIEY